MTGFESWLPNSGFPSGAWPNICSPDASEAALVRKRRPSIRPSWSAPRMRNGQRDRPEREADGPAPIAYDGAVTAPVVVILAAGEGTRMRSQKPKLLHEICGRPMIAWPVTAAIEAGAEKVVVV